MAGKESWSVSVAVPINQGAGDAPPEDGYRWKKYGTKRLKGASFPKTYYRCRKRELKDCRVTKQVRRSTEDPSLVEVTYHGHTCLETPTEMHDEEMAARSEDSENEETNVQDINAPEDNLEKASVHVGPKAEVEEVDEEKGACSLYDGVGMRDETEDGVDVAMPEDNPKITLALDLENNPLPDLNEPYIPPEEL